jgi:hypothetical protein
VPSAKKPILTRSAFFLVSGLLVLAAGFLAVFLASHHGIATIGDDSVSYLILARHFAGSADPHVAQWLAFQAHFPPLFPMALALAGGADDFERAHRVVAIFSALALFPICLHASREFGRDAAGFLIVLLFLLTPTAWVSIKGILSESMYLFISMGAILYFEARVSGGRATTTRWLLFGILLACAWLTRAIGFALVLAYFLQASIRVARDKAERDFRPLLPLVPVAILVGAWFLLRPAANQYSVTIASVTRSWLDDPAHTFLASATYLHRGWIASFNAEADASLVPGFIYSAIGLLGLAGAARRVLANRLDGWYVAASLGIIFFWVFNEENMRRLLYPLLPLLLIFAGQSLVALCHLCAMGRFAGTAALLTSAIVAVLCMPAALTVFERSRDTGPGRPGLKYAYAGITDYYSTINSAQARAIAARQIAVLTGLEALDEATPPGSKVMWMRPEYIATLGRREGVPWYFRWDRKTLAREIANTGTGFVIVSTLFKSDLDGSDGDPFATLGGIDAYSWPVFSIRNFVTGRAEFVLWKVDSSLLDAALKAD